MLPHHIALSDRQVQSVAKRSDDNGEEWEVSVPGTRQTCWPTKSFFICGTYNSALPKPSTGSAETQDPRATSGTHRTRTQARPAVVERNLGEGKWRDITQPSIGQRARPNMLVRCLPSRDRWIQHRGKGGSRYPRRAPYGGTGGSTTSSSSWVWS